MKGLVNTGVGIVKGRTAARPLDKLMTVQERTDFILRRLRTCQLMNEDDHVPVLLGPLHAVR